MILEVATVDLRPGTAEDFERAFAQARSIIAAQRGCRSVELRRCMERPDRYLLLVGWDTLADHTEGFRGGPDYPRWRELLHHFYDPFPTVEHFTEVALG